MSETAIYRIEEWYDSAGRHITARAPLDGSPVLYTGYSKGQLKNPAGQGVNLDFFFDIEADDITSAFVVYDELAAAKWPEVAEQFKKDARKQQSRIKIADSVDEMIISGGNGKG